MNKILNFPPKKLPAIKGEPNPDEAEIIEFFREQKKQEKIRLVAIMGILGLAIALTIILPLWISLHIAQFINNIFH